MIGDRCSHLQALDRLSGVSDAAASLRGLVSTCCSSSGCIDVKGADCSRIRRTVNGAKEESREQSTRSSGRERKCASTARDYTAERSGWNGLINQRQHSGRWRAACHRHFRLKLWLHPLQRALLPHQRSRLEGESQPRHYDAQRRHTMPVADTPAVDLRHHPPHCGELIEWIR